MFGSLYTNPDSPDFDRGLCDQDRTHLASFTVAAQATGFVARALGSWAQDWRVSAIVSARSGAPITVIAGVDRAYTGIRNQRVNQVLANPYGHTTLDLRGLVANAIDLMTPQIRPFGEEWLDPAAFEQPAAGTLGNFRRNSLRGPAFWAVDAAVSRLVSLGGSRRVELRVEAFNVFNTFNWNVPDVNFSSPAFGRITSMAGTPRILQFGVRYTF